jgi:hypothetical protein
MPSVAFRACVALPGSADFLYTPVMVRYQILYWKNLPSQVKVFEKGQRPVSRQLPEPYQTAITRAAMAQGLAGTDDYLSHWQWSPNLEREGSAEEVADALIRELQEETGTGKKE